MGQIGNGTNSSSWAGRNMMSFLITLPSQSWKSSNQIDTILYPQREMWLRFMENTHLTATTKVALGKNLFIQPKTGRSVAGSQSVAEIMPVCVERGRWVPPFVQASAVGTLSLVVQLTCIVLDRLSSSVPVPASDSNSLSYICSSGQRSKRWSLLHVHFQPWVPLFNCSRKTRPSFRDQYLASVSTGSGTVTLWIQMGSSWVGESLQSVFLLPRDTLVGYTPRFP